MKIEDIHVGQDYYVWLAGKTYLITVLAKSDTETVCRYRSVLTTLKPTWFVAKAAPQPSVWSRVMSIFSPGLSEP